MATNLDWFQRQFLIISRDEDVLNILSDIKVALIGLNSAQLKYIARNLSLNSIFDCLNSSSNEQIQLGCAVLKTLMSAQDPADILKQYASALIRALRHPNVEVKELILDEFNRAACESDLVSLFDEWLDLMLTMVECVAHENTSVSRGSIRFFIRRGTNRQSLTSIYSPAMLEAFNRIMKASDVIRYRVYEIAVEISVASKPGLEASHSCSLLPNLLNELKKDDILVKLTALEMVTKLAMCYHGYEYLESNSVISHLAETLSTADKDPLYGLILPGLLKFFGNVGQLRPHDVFGKYPQIAECITNALKLDDICVQCVAIETVGYIASTPEGKLTLSRQGNIMEFAMGKIMDVIKKAPHEFRVRAMNTVSNIIKLEPNDQDCELLKTTQGWFNKLGNPQETMQMFVTICQQPFLEFQLAFLLLVQALAEQAWGQQCIQQQPGLIEIILDRNNQANCMEAKSLKYKVIQTLATSASAEAVFGEEVVERLRQYVKEGPVYVPAELEVAIEGAS